MNALVEFYAKQAVSNRPSWFKPIQQQAYDELQRFKFPTRADEEWKYTSLDAFTKKQFFFPKQDAVKNTASPAFNGAKQLLIENGYFNDSNLNLDDLPPGVIIKPISQALNDHAELISSYLGKILQSEHGFHAFNTLAFTSGLFIYIPENTQLEKTLLIDQWQDVADSGVNHRHLIMLGENSQATILNLFHGAPQAVYFTNTITEVLLAKRSVLTHYTIQQAGKSSVNINHLAVEQREESNLFSHNINLGGQLVRSDITVNLKEIKARCLLNGLYMPEDHQHIDQHTTIVHQVPECFSQQDYKGILSGRGRAVFNGKINVAKHALYTEALQQNKNLLLSPLAEINTKPQLEIFADDVICSHGATVGQLDEDALFYLLTRGIERADAMRYLIHAFAENNLRFITDKTISEWIAHLINQQLKGWYE